MRLAASLVLFAAVVLPACGPARSRDTAAAVPRDVPSGLTPAAWDAYEGAKAAVRARDYPHARDLFEEAVRVQPDFTEAWYNLGATQVHLALAAVRAQQDREAVAAFRQAVDSKKTARGLMEQNRWYVYLRPAEQDQVRSDVDNGLKDADEVLADEASLLAALRLWAATVH